MTPRGGKEKSGRIVLRIVVPAVLFFLLIITPSPTHAQQQMVLERLGPGESMNLSQSLVSPSGNFKLGFFDIAAGNGSRNWYLGVWYNNISVRTVVWVANRRKPVPDAGAGMLSLGSGAGADLRVTNSAGDLFWSSSGSGNNNTNSSTKVIAKLLDSGNLVVVTSPDGSFSWQSFDYPTDTLLPGMMLGWDRKSGLYRNLTSWKSPTDPSPGDHSLVLDMRGIPQMFVLTSTTTTNTTPVPRWRGGPWNGQWFTGVPEMRSYTMFAIQYIVSSSDEVAFSYLTSDPSVTARLALNHTGTLEGLVWIGNAGIWNEFCYVPRDTCDVFSTCGAFGVCDTGESPVCTCATGFQPRHPQEWYLRDGSGGCVRKTPLDCTNGTDGFVVVRDAKLPDTSRAALLPDTTMSLDRCREACLANCSCTAYAAANITTGNGCFLWAGDLIDVRTFPVGGQDLYVRVARADLDEHSSSLHRRRARLITILVCISVSATVLAGVIWTCIARKKNKKLCLIGLALTRSEGSLSDRLRASTKIESSLDLELPLFQFSEIAAATDFFSEKNKLGRGGFGTVYRGHLDDGVDVAVKRLGKNSTQGVDEFTNEVKLIAKLQHRNLVRILGCCVQEEERILIYEYSQNRSLDIFLFDREKAASLDWSTRYQIIMGIARGLVYLHHDSRLRIIHRDLKASNILLDKDMIPKISDFGMARIFGADDTEVNTRRVVGTYGYMSPEYAMDGVFSTKADVFSFGVLVLEIISGMKNQGFYLAQPQQNLLSYVWTLWKEGKSLDIVDKSIGTSFSLVEVLKCIKIGLLCVQELPDDRPTMSSIVCMLVADSSTFPQPKQPGFTITRGHFDGNSSSGTQDPYSVNGITLTVINGR